jgi:hypothetical protein
MFPKYALPFSAVTGLDRSGATLAPIAPAAIGARRSAGWQSPQDIPARRVEGAMLVAIAGYFVTVTLVGLHLFRPLAG